MLAEKKVLLIGAGALGSALAELLVRGGAGQLAVMDGDSLEVGNLSRHTLGVSELKTLKAESLAKHLNAATPHATVKALNCLFPPNKDEERTETQRSDIVIDCTGSDEVLHDLELFPWEGAKVFVSLSLGFRARHLFCFTAFCEHFPHGAFREAISPWLQQELEEYDGQEFPREGIGCWHPVFPARADDIWMMASIALKHLESVAMLASAPTALAVYEQELADGKFVGVHQVAGEPCNVPS